MSTPKVWLVTGASSGFGRHMTELVLSRGDIVVATARTPESLHDLAENYTSERLLLVKLDVSKLSDIKAAFSKTQEVFGRLDVVFNNAGYTIVGEAEGTPEDMARSMFDTNFWGNANVSKEAVRFFREVNKPGVGGKLIVIGSMCGYKGFPVYSYYCASRHALEGFTESLAKELLPSWNIQVCIIEPGHFDTPANQRILTQGYNPPHPAYSDPNSASMIIRSWMTDGKTHGSDPVAGVQKMYELTSLEKLPLRVPLGMDAVRAYKENAEERERIAETFGSWSKDIASVGVYQAGQ